MMKMILSIEYKEVSTSTKSIIIKHNNILKEENFMIIPTYNF